MASVIKAGNATDGVQVTSDNTGILELKTGTGSGTTAMTVGTGQNVTFAQAANLPNTFGFKNRIINGGMVIDQRNAGASVAFTNGFYAVDRFVVAKSSTAVGTLQRSTTAPAGFINSLVATCTTGASPASGDYNMIWQMIEGFNIADLGWGTANAQPVTIGFWVRSSLTGTFAGALANDGYTRGYVFTYTISAANTWEYKTVTIAGDTTGTWLTNNGVGIRVTFDLGTGTGNEGTAGSWNATVKYTVAGAQKVMATTGATFFITGVQLEKGSTATSFDYRPYGTELQLCQRYYYKNTQLALFSARALSTPNANCGLMTYWPVTMRAAPTVAETGSGNITSLAVAGITLDGAYWTGSASSAVSTANITGYTASIEL